MSVLDKVVRTVETDTAPRRIPSEQTRASEKIVLRAGRTGSGRTFSGSASVGMTFYCEAHENESRKNNGGEGIKATPRKTHVRRFWKEDEDGSNRDENVWVDVQRIDELVVTSEPGAQDLTYHMKWYEDDEGTDNPQRKMKTVKVYNPDDENMFVRIPSIQTADWNARPHSTRPSIPQPSIVGEMDSAGKTLGLFQGQFSGNQDERSHFKHEVDADGKSTGTTTRESEIRVVAHRDVEAEPDENGFFPNDDYDLPTDEESIDDSQKVNFEFPTRVTLHSGSALKEQLTYTNLRQEYLLDLFTQTPEGGSGNSEPTRLDPFQNIVNVRWGVELVALEFAISTMWDDTWLREPPPPHNELPWETIDDITDFPCGPGGVKFLTFDPNRGRTPSWTHGYKKKIRSDVVLVGIHGGKFNKNSSIGGSEGAYEWGQIEGVEITGGLTFGPGHDPNPGTENLDEWHTPGMPRTKDLTEWTYIGGSDYHVKFDLFEGGDFLDDQGRRINTPSFGFNGGLNTRPEDGVFKTGTEATGLAISVEILDPLDGHECWSLNNPFVFQQAPYGYETTVQTFIDQGQSPEQAQELFDNYLGFTTYEVPFPYPNWNPLEDEGDVADEFTVDFSGLTVTLNGETLVAVAVGGNKDFVSVLMRKPETP